eukprot:XP_014784321.1 PREDICTED: regulator of G-protein signaling 4-like [Octopus bimaculoides]
MNPWQLGKYEEFIKKDRENEPQNISDHGQVNPNDTKDKYNKWKESFVSMINDDEGFSIFRDYLTSQYCDENLDFWKAVEDFRIEPDDTQIRARAGAIYKRFIMKGAPRCINLRSKSREKLGEQLKGPITRSFFDEMQKEILEVMQRDPYQRFLRSEYYRNLCT